VNKENGHNPEGCLVLRIRRMDTTLKVDRLTVTQHVRCECQLMESYKVLQPQQVLYKKLVNAKPSPDGWSPEHVHSCKPLETCGLSPIPEYYRQITCTADIRPVAAREQHYSGTFSLDSTANQSLGPCPNNPWPYAPASLTPLQYSPIKKPAKSVTPRTSAPS
jgi:hypothetical protein